MRRKYAVVLAVLAPLLLAAGCSGAQRMTISGSSMAPALSSGDKIIVDKQAYESAEPQRGDIVAFKDDGGKTSVKRVVGLPGETVEIRGGRVFIDGNELDEGYLNDAAAGSGEDAQWLVPEGCVFVMGDNRASSRDSRAFGPVRLGSVIGRVTK